MSIDSVRTIALSGLTAAQRRLEVSARNVANSETDGYRRVGVETTAHAGGGVVLEADGTERVLSSTNIATEQVARVKASNAFAANLKVLETALEMDDAILDLKG